MNRDEAGKIFVGGLSWNTTQDMLKDHFSKYGQVVDCVVMKNPQTNKSRGFGFVTFRDPSVVEIVLAEDSHNIDGRNVDAKECNSKAAAMNKFNPSGPSRHNNRQSLMKTTKIFLGGLPNEADENLLKTIFSRYGMVKDVVIMMDPQKQRSRGFGFLTFETEESVNEACKDHYVEVNGKKVECKRAEPRSGGGGGPMMGGRGGGGPDRRMRGPQNGGFGQGGPPYGQQEWGGGAQWNQSAPHMNQGPPRFQQPNMGYQGNMNGGPGGPGGPSGPGGYQQPPYQQGWGQQPPQEGFAGGPSGPGMPAKQLPAGPGGPPGGPHHGQWGSSPAGSQQPQQMPTPAGAHAYPPAPSGPGARPPMGMAHHQQAGPRPDTRFSQPPQQAAPGYNYNYGGQQQGQPQPSADPYAQPPAQNPGYGAPPAQAAALPAAIDPSAAQQGASYNYGYGDQAYGAQPAAAQPAYGGGDPSQQAYGGGAQYAQRQGAGAQAYHPYRR